MAADAPRLIAPDEHKQLVLDTRVIVSARNARLVPGAVTKDARNPLLPADKPWENAMNNLYPNVLWDEQEAVFKLWYKCVLSDKEVIAKMDGPSTVHEVGWYLLYATSKNGVAWDKPALDLHRFDGRSGANIVARDTPNAGVFKDTHEHDPQRRYKMVYDVGLGKPRVRFSADGIHWSEPEAPQGFSGQNGDTHNNSFWDERLQRYLWFTKLYYGERTIARLESTDFKTWKNSGMVLRSSWSEGRASQTYALTPFRYGNVWLGYVMMYHVGSGRTVDAELAWSPDSLTWQRVTPGHPILPLGAKGAPDSQCIYAPSGPPIAQGGDLLIYYGGSDVPHTGWKRHCLLSLARLPLDRWAGYEPVEKTSPAVLESGLLRVVKPLTVSADISTSLRVTALDANGAVLAESEPLTATGTDVPVRWRGEPGFSRPMRFRFELMNAKLFAIGGVALTDQKLPEPVNPLRHQAPRPIQIVRMGFDHDTEGWKGVDQIEHHAAGGVKGGYITATRGKGLHPFPFLPADAAQSPLAGDWSQRIGGRGAVISASLRSPKAGGNVKFELFAGDIAAWVFTAAKLGEGWTPASAKLRYGWSDAEARAAGWQPGPTAFSWAETIAHVGKVVILHDGPPDGGRVDLDEVVVTGED
jgi:hypothetical protein